MGQIAVNHAFDRIPMCGTNKAMQPLPAILALAATRQDVGEEQVKLERFFERAQHIWPEAERLRLKVRREKIHSLVVDFGEPAVEIAVGFKLDRPRREFFEGVRAAQHITPGRHDELVVGMGTAQHSRKLLRPRF